MTTWPYWPFGGRGRRIARVPAQPDMKRCRDLMPGQARRESVAPIASVPAANPSTDRLTWMIVQVREARGGYDVGRTTTRPKMIVPPIQCSDCPRSRHNGMWSRW